MDKSTLIKTIINDSSKFILTGFAASLGFMTHQMPDSNELEFHWSADKLFYSMVGSILLSFFIAIIRYFMWINSHDRRRH
ncbi:hypothetical protein mvi_65000 (plasmid) [Methylobacterium indicum]|uniref:Uncharacterized protein n=1 Tax=Methylobacterium indicum TaxID=1775910 RepID=A0A8H8X124_9HYPH|nr:hypothetical protein mvi_65000 [Methylobacterium indicum]